MTRDKVIKFLNDKNTYNTIMGILDYKLSLHSSRDILMDYPTHSFIAGGAISNIIYYLLNKNKFDAPVINDIDLFCIERTNLVIRYANSNSDDSFIHTDLNEEINMDGYGRVWRGSAGETLSMVSSNRFGVLNEVKIDVRLFNGREFKETNYYLEILKVFDLNCCSSGIDRVSEKIVYTDKFIDFLITNKIEVTNIGQPLQTTYRLHKKIEELKTDKSNLDIEMNLIQHSRFKSKVNWIGPEWLTKLKVNSKLFHKYFEGGPMTGYIPFDGAESYCIKDFKLQKYVNDFEFSILDNNSIISFWDLFVRKKNIKNLNKILDFYKNIGHIKIDSVGFIKSLFKKQRPIWFSEKEIRFNKEFNRKADDSCIINFLGKCPNYLDCDFTISDLNTINNFNKFLITTLHFDCQIFLVDNVKDHIKMIEYFYKRFMENGVFREGLFGKIILKQKKLTKLSSFNYDEKVKSIEKILNDLWIKDYHNDYYGIKHRFIKRKKFNTIDLNDNFVF